MERAPLPAVMIIFILTSGCMANAPDLDGDGFKTVKIWILMEMDGAMTWS